MQSKKKAVAGFDQNSKVAGYVHHFNYKMNFANVKAVCFEAYYHERLFLCTGSDRSERHLQRRRASMNHARARKLYVTLIVTYFFLSKFCNVIMKTVQISMDNRRTFATEDNLGMSKKFF